MPGRTTASKSKTDTWTEKELAKQLDRRGGKRHEARSSGQQVAGRVRQGVASTSKEDPERVRHEAKKDRAAKQSEGRRSQDTSPAPVRKRIEEGSRSERGGNGRHKPSTVRGIGVPADLHSSSQSSLPREGRPPATKPADRKVKSIKVMEDPPTVPEEMDDSPVAVEVQPMVEVKEELSQEEEEEEEKYSNEEFEEDYDEDFDSSEGEEEEEEGGEREELLPPADVEGIKRAIEEENKTATEQSSPADSNVLPSAPPPPRLLSSHPVLSFSAPPRPTGTARRMKRRAEALQEMVVMDAVTVNLLDLAPASEYEVYMRSFGSENSRQVASQTGDECDECEVQTDAVESRDQWVQWPPEDLKGYGGEGEGGESEESVVVDSQQLLAFLRRAGQLCCSLLEEETLGEGEGKLNSDPSLPFCKGSQLLTAAILHSPPSCLHCRGDLLLAGAPHVGHGSWRGVVVVWRTSLPSSPQHLLVCHALPVSTCSSPHKTALVFGGCEDGSIVVWDLREPRSMHTHRSQQPDKGPTLRAPTYSTAGLMGFTGHNQPVLQLAAVSSGTHLSCSEEQEGILSYQLASLDSSGLLAVWVVVDLPNTDPAGSQTELGLAPGGRVKLVLSSTTALFSLPAPLGAPSLTDALATCFSFSPGDTSRVLVGTDTGVVLHHTRYRKRSFPHTYQSSPAYTHVTSISFCPGDEQLFLTGCSDGSLSIFSIKYSDPLVRWPSACEGGVDSVHWLAGTLGMFAVMTAGAVLQIWDLLKSDAEPIHTAETGSGCCLAASPSSSSSHLAMGREDGSILLLHLPTPHGESERREGWAQFLTNLT